jgi:hypothetical protein
LSKAADRAPGRASIDARIATMAAGTISARIDINPLEYEVREHVD